MRPTLSLSLPKSRLSSFFGRRPASLESLKSGDARVEVHPPLLQTSLPPTPTATDVVGSRDLEGTPELESSVGLGDSFSSDWILKTPNGHAGAKVTSPVYADHEGFEWIGTGEQEQGLGLWLGESVEHVEDPVDVVSPLRGTDDYFGSAGSLMSPLALCDSPVQTTLSPLGLSESSVPMTSPATSVSRFAFARRASQALEERKAKIKASHRTWPVGWPIKPEALSQDEEGELEEAKKKLMEAEEVLKGTLHGMQRMASVIRRSEGKVEPPSHQQMLKLQHATHKNTRCETTDVAIRLQYIDALAAYNVGIEVVKRWRASVKELEAKRDGLRMKRTKMTAEEKAIDDRQAREHRALRKALRARTDSDGGRTARCTAWTAGQYASAKSGVMAKSQRLMSRTARQDAEASSEDESSSSSSEVGECEGVQTVEKESDGEKMEISVAEGEIDVALTASGIGYWYGRYEAQQGQTLASSFLDLYREPSSDTARRLARSYLTSMLAMSLLLIDFLASCGSSVRAGTHHYRSACAAFITMLVLSAARWRFATFVTCLALAGQILSLPSQDRSARKIAPTAAIAFLLFSVSAPDPLVIFLIILGLVNVHLILSTCWSRMGKR